MKIGVLIGGTGRTLKNLIERKFDIKCVVAHKPVPGLQYAIENNIPHTCDKDVFGYLESHDVELAVMAGWIKLLEIPPKWTNRVMNIHPSLIPAFSGKGMYGHHVHEAVIASGVKLSGCTVHFVDNEYDHGPIITQQSVPVYENDTPETLANRVFKMEVIVYPMAIHLFAQDKLVIAGRRVNFKP